MLQSEEGRDHPQTERTEGMILVKASTKKVAETKEKPTLKAKVSAKPKVAPKPKAKTIPKAKSAPKGKTGPQEKPVERQVQYVALPFRLENGKVSVLLVTSRETRRWILPKGRAEKNLAPHQVAELEAFEEGGVKGEASVVAFARYAGSKRLDNGVEIPCEMVVYPLKVRETLDDWREKSQRERRWLSPAEAATVVGEEGLIAVLLDFATLWP